MWWCSSHVEDVRCVVKLQVVCGGGGDVKKNVS